MSHLSKSDAIFTALAILFCVNLVLTNILAVKIFTVPLTHIALSAGDLLYPLSFLITDIVTEIWGEKRSRFVVTTGFFMCLFMLAAVQLTLYLPPHPFWVSPDNGFNLKTADEYQNALEAVFQMGGFLVLASSAAYWASQLVDIRLFQLLKQSTAGRHLWLRNNVSTMTSQTIDSLIFTTIYFFWGVGLSAADCAQLFAFMLGFKLIFALVDTPLCYLGVATVRRLMRRESRYVAAQHPGGFFMEPEPID